MDGGYLTDPAVLDEPRRQEGDESLFPLWKSVAGDRTLPRPWSVAFVGYWQAQDYDIVSAEVAIPPLPPVDVDVSGTDAKIDTQSLGLKGSLWVLPFLNVHATVGYSQTDSDIFLRDVPVAIIPPSEPGEGPEYAYGDRFLQLGFDGPYLALGATAVGGWDRWWFSLTGSYAVARLDATQDFIGTNDFTTIRALPKVGLTLQGVIVWLGASWMDEEMVQKGSLDGFEYDVLVTRADWTPVVGLRTVLGGRWDLTVEGGFGNRISAMFTVGYNF